MQPGIIDTKSEGARFGTRSFRVRHLAARQLWRLVWLLLAAWTPPPLFAWRRLLLRLFGAELAPTALVYGSARIWHPPNLRMGELATLGPRVDCYCMAPISIGDFAVVSQDAFLCAGTHDIDDPDFQLVAKPIAIGRNAWIAADAFVGPGVTVQEGAVLGARGVAFTDLEAWGVYIGNPARRLRQRPAFSRPSPAR